MVNSGVEMRNTASQAFEYVLKSGARKQKSNCRIAASWFEVKFVNRGGSIIGRL